MSLGGMKQLWPERGLFSFEQFFQVNTVLMEFPNGPSGSYVETRKGMGVCRS